ncbi:MAG TPA: hypothetical protein VD948_00560 [Rhodothermales bacterium]|nr:hypothetical protein [Rhodothermales bacterium]
MTRLDLAPAIATTAQHREPSLFYAPPYERPVEDELAWHLVKYLDPEIGLLYQHRALTPAGPVWVDFVVEAVLPGGLVRRIGIDLTEASDDLALAEMRDALLVGTGALDAHYRLPAEAARVRLLDALAVLATCEPELFSERGRLNLERLATDEARTIEPAPEASAVEVPAPAVDEDDPWAAAPEEAFTITRRASRFPVTWLDAYTKALDALGVAAQADVRRAA